LRCYLSGLKKKGGSLQKHSQAGGEFGPATEGIAKVLGGENLWQKTLLLRKRDQGIGGIYKGGGQSRENNAIMDEKVVITQ